MQEYRGQPSLLSYRDDTSARATGELVRARPKRALEVAVEPVTQLRRAIDVLPYRCRLRESERSAEHAVVT